MNPDRKAEDLSKKLITSFKRRAARGDKYPLLWALHETFHIEIWFGGACQLVASMLQVLSPFVLRYLIAFATKAYFANKRHTPAPSIGHGIGLVIAVTIMQIVQSMGTNHFIYRGQIVGGQARGVLITLIFEKTLKISGRARAGGKAITDGNDQEAENGPKSNPAVQDGWFKGMAKKYLLPKGPPKMGDIAKGVSGNGAGWGNGRVVNLMSVDAYRIDQASGMFHLVWTSPIAIVITLILLLINLSYSALAGFGLLVVGAPFLTSAIKKLFVRRQAINKVTDLRVSLTQEILQAVRFVKYFGWESSFLERISDIRKNEIRLIQILLSIRNGINAVSMSLPIFASMLSFITFSLSNHSLDPAPIFSSLALFNSLRLPLSLLPLVIGQVIDAWASVQRIQDFFLEEEQDDDFIRDMEEKNAFKMDHAEFTWERTVTQDPTKPGMDNKKNQKQDKRTHQISIKTSDPINPVDVVESTSILTQVEPFRLHDINLSVGRNELIAVIGGVGSGKSSLLAALAGDMRRTSGAVTMGASRAFCPQYAWIQNATVRENILFGKEYDRKWYNEVIDACALRPDLEMLPNSDQTEIGERGITISGGQKQRINIARAIFFNSDIVLMDDPLSGESSNHFSTSHGYMITDKKLPKQLLMPMSDVISLTTQYVAC